MTKRLVNNDSAITTVSIGLPVYNGAEYLREALDSLLAQTFTDFELIVSDNASTDATAEIIRDYQQMDPRVRYFCQKKNIGSGANFLYVLHQARGELFMWAAHDDIWANNWLEVLVQNITHKDVGIRGKLILIRDGKKVSEKLLPNYPCCGFIQCFMANENNYRSHYTYSLFFRVKLLSISEEIFFLDYYPDAIFTYALLHHGKLRTLPSTHILYRLHEKNAGIDLSNRWRGWQKILYRIHPMRYYLYHLRYTDSAFMRFVICVLIPIKHLYAQVSFWIRGFRELITGIKVI